jgi:hypothetical protein
MPLRSDRYSPFVAPVLTHMRALNASLFLEIGPLVSTTYTVVESFVIKGSGPLTSFADLVYACYQDQRPKCSHCTVGSPLNEHVDKSP